MILADFDFQTSFFLNKIRKKNKLRRKEQTCTYAFLKQGGQQLTTVSWTVLENIINADEADEIQFLDSLDDFIYTFETLR